MYIFYDGDNIGKMFAERFQANDLNGLRALSTSLQMIHLQIKLFTETAGGHIIEAGGDEGLLRCKYHQVIDEYVQQMWKLRGLSVSVGIGSTAAWAYQHCHQLKMLAKVKA